jgi:hypothetical protein
MGRRRRINSKKNTKCHICNKTYASRQSLYFHNYTYHRHQPNEINIDNNVEIYHNIDNSDNESIPEMNYNNYEGQLDNKKLNDTLEEHIDKHLINSYIQKINIVKDNIASKISNLNIQDQDQEIKQIVEETKPPVNKEPEVKEIDFILTEPKIKESNVKEIKQVHNKEQKQVYNKEQISEKSIVSEDKIINDVILLLNNCINNKIGISVNVELSNSTITVINKLKN